MTLRSDAQRWVLSGIALLISLLFSAALAYTGEHILEHKAQLAPPDVPDVQLQVTPDQLVRTQ